MAALGDQCLTSGVNAASADVIKNAVKAGKVASNTEIQRRPLLQKIVLHR